MLDTDVSYGHRGVSRLRPERHRKLDVAALGPQVLTFWAGFKELASGEQDFECASVGQGQDFRAVVCWGYLPKVLIFFCVVSKAGAFTERGGKIVIRSQRAPPLCQSFKKGMICSRTG